MLNFIDFFMLERISGVMVRYVKDFKELKNFNLIIIFGIKNIIEDLRVLKENKLFYKIKEVKENGIFIFGICGGY